MWETVLRSFTHSKLHPISEDMYYISLSAIADMYSCGSRFQDSFQTLSSIPKQGRACTAVDVIYSNNEYKQYNTTARNTIKQNSFFIHYMNCMLYRFYLLSNSTLGPYYNMHSNYSSQIIMLLHSNYKSRF